MEYFESLEDLFNAMHRDVDAANSRVTDEQRAIGYGDYFIRIWEGNPFMGPGHLTIYGHVTPRDTFMKEEKELGAGDDELSWTMHSHDDSYRRGFRFGWHYSVVEPDGELGSTHISTMKKITREEFEAAKARGWEDKE